VHLDGVEARKVHVGEHSGLSGMLGGMRKNLRFSRRLGVLISAAAYLVALLAATLVVRAAGLGHPRADLALGTLVATVVVFLVSVAADNSSIYDPYWSVQPLAFAGYYLWTGWGHGAGIGMRQVIVVSLVCLYALRLTSNFYRDWPGLGKEDFRYRSFRERFGRFYWPVSFAGIHLFPTVMVYLGCLPLYAVFRPETNGLNWLDWAGVLVVLGAIALAFVADEQLRAFRGLPANQGRVVGGGLWARSRHPNYLGEISTWWGLWLCALAAGGRWWWTMVGATAITVMFVFGSIPMMERRLLRTRAGYAEYREQTGMLAPRLFGRAVRTERTSR
jgi:steroid 5-alpha reductase family enzyme